MRLTEDRYSRDLRRHDLALRLIAFEARTNTICYYTGLSASRVRSLGKSDYATKDGVAPVRHRGPSPYRASAILTDPRYREDVSIVGAVRQLLYPAFFDSFGGADAHLNAGEYLCAVFEGYIGLALPPSLTFEQVLLLEKTLARGKLASTTSCTNCSALVVRDSLSLGGLRCKQCLSPETRYRNSAQMISLSEVAETGSLYFQEPLF